MTTNSNTETLNLTSQLGKLLCFISDVATAIRMHTPYNGRYEPRDPAHALDVLWLADSLHNFATLGRMVRGGSPTDIKFACDMLLRQFALYRKDKGASQLKGDPKATFERNVQLANLDDGVTVITEILDAITPYLATHHPANA